jgi:chemosensory pili system protein ChpA (sensor histidine kinase/response regulator)
VAAAAPAETGLEEDDEMREIFLEEAREVIETARASLDHLVRQPDDLESLTSVRRAFHTLKGSSRMVGLTQYGEAAWSFEQLYNAWLATQEPANGDLLGVSHEVLSHFSAWTDAIAEGQAASWRHEPVTAVAEALRLHGQRLSLSDVAQPAAPEVVTPPDAPSEADALAPFELDLSAEDLGVVEVPEATEEAEEAEEAEAPLAATELPHREHRRFRHRTGPDRTDGGERVVRAGRA